MGLNKFLFSQLKILIKADRELKNYKNYCGIMNCISNSHLSLASLSSLPSPLYLIVVSTKNINHSESNASFFFAKGECKVLSAINVNIKSTNLAF